MMIKNIIGDDSLQQKMAYPCTVEEFHYSDSYSHCNSPTASVHQSCTIMAKHNTFAHIQQRLGKRFMHTDL